MRHGTANVGSVPLVTELAPLSYSVFLNVGESPPPPPPRSIVKMFRVR